jgi:hypothetical protein
MNSTLRLGSKERRSGRQVSAAIVVPVQARTVAQRTGRRYVEFASHCDRDSALVTMAIACPWDRGIALATALDKRVDQGPGWQDSLEGAGLPGAFCVAQVKKQE